MRSGKLPPALLGQLLGRIPRDDPRVIVGSGIGEDAAVIDFIDQGGDRLLVAKTDPITFVTDVIGWYAVHVNANDIACAGAVPRWFMATALLPERWTEAQVAALFDQLVEACRAAGVSLVGGHTEVTGGLDRPIISGCMLGEVARERVVRTAGGQPGDALILTRGIAIEGTAVLAREVPVQLRQQGMADDAVERAQRLLFDPGISVVRAARTLCDVLQPHGALHSLHDPTEGGLAGGLWELAEASAAGATMEAAAIPVLPETRQVCRALGVEPMGLLASGALLAAVAPAYAETALTALAGVDIPAQVIGHLTPRSEGLHLVGPDGRRPWPAFDRDEVARFFDASA